MDQAVGWPRVTGQDDLDGKTLELMQNVVSESVGYEEQTAERALEILGSNELMAISTVRPDGWPQTTFVGYANDGFTLFFMIFRDSQKYSNIKADGRVSLAVGAEPPDMHFARAFYAAAIASEVTGAETRTQAWQILKARHSNLVGTPVPSVSTTAIMRAECLHMSVLDYRLGLGHAEPLDLPAFEE